MKSKKFLRDLKSTEMMMMMIVVIVEEVLMSLICSMLGYQAVLIHNFPSRKFLMASCLRGCMIAKNRSKTQQSHVDKTSRAPNGIAFSKRDSLKLSPT